MNPTKNKSRRNHKLACLATLSALACASGCKPNPAVQKQKYLQSGKTYVSQGKPREAVIQFSNALKLDGGFIEAHAALAQTYLSLGNAPGAYRELVRTVDLAPSNVDARIQLGTLIAESGSQPDKAVEQAKAVLALDPRNAAAYGLLARVELQQGDLDKARSDVQQALAIDPNRAPFHVLLGLIETRAAAHGDLAEKEFRNALSLDPQNPLAHLYLAVLLEKKGDAAGAEAAYTQAAKEGAQNPAAQAATAGFYVRAGQPGKAEATLRNFVEQAPDSPEGVDLLREYYTKAGQLDRAETVYRELSQKFPKSDPIRVSYAYVLVQRNNFPEAQKVVAQLPGKPAMPPSEAQLRALLLLHDNHAKDALTLLQKAAETAPANVPLHLLIAQVANGLGENEVAEASYNQVLRVDPTNLQAETGLAMAAGRIGDLRRLGRLAETALAAHPDFTDAYLWRATVEASQRLFDQAESDFRLVIRKDPAKLPAYRALGMMLVQQNRSAEGKAMLEHALTLAPDSIDILTLLARLDIAEKKPAAALARVQQQIQKSPQNPALYTLLGSLQLSQKDFHGALASAGKSMQLDGGSPASLAVYTQAQISLGGADQAIDTWQRWSAGHPTDAHADLILATLEEAKGDQGKAMEYYRKTLSLKPDQALAANNLAYLMVEKGQDLNTALSLAQTAHRGMPNSPDCTDTLAWVYFHMRSYDWARDLLEQAVKANPESATVQYHLGLTYSRLNKKEEAASHLRKAMTIAPGTPAANDAKTALDSL